MNMKTYLGISGLILIFTFSGCIKDNSAQLQRDEQTKLQNYLTVHKITVQPTADGLYYIENKAGTGVTPVLANYIIVEYTNTLIDGTVIETTDSTKAANYNILPIVAYHGPLKIKLSNYWIQGFVEGVSMMKEGGTAQFIIPSKIAYGAGSSSIIPQYATILSTVELVRVIKDPVADDRASINRWLDSLKIQHGDSTEDGIYLKIDKDTVGDLISSYQTVNIFYSEKLLDGTFISGTHGKTTYSFIVGNNTIIPKGFEKAILLLKNGSHARFILPYYMAYGASGYVNGYYQFQVPPYSSTIYDVTITSVTKK